MVRRDLVLVGDELAKDNNIKPGPGTSSVHGRIIANTSGFAQRGGDNVSVIPFSGLYEPRPGDTVVGIVKEANPGNWIVDIGAPWPAPLHVSEAPWRVDFGETMEYLRPGDAILCKILFVDEQKKIQVTLKDRNLTKLEGGEVMDISPVKVARVIGKNGSMLNLVKGYVECWLYVGQNGRVWLNGDPAEVLLAKEVIRMIAREANEPGVTDRVRAFLEERKPGGVDVKSTHGMDESKDKEEE